MTAEYTQIRNELQQMRQEPPKTDRNSPVFDFGLFILLYFFALVLVATALLALGLGIQKYTCFYALPLAWLALAWYRKSPFYALMITAAGALFLLACAAFVSQFFDMAWDSSSYHKVETGLLVRGWNPFGQTLSSYANATSYLPYNPNWLQYPVDNQPKATYLIGASFTAYAGNIAVGKVFNIAAIAAGVCIIASLLRDALRMNFLVSMLTVSVTIINPITLAQSLTYYPDGFAFQMLTIVGASLFYMAYKPENRFVRDGGILVFLAACLAVNTAGMAMLFCLILCTFYFIARVTSIAQSGVDRLERRRLRKRMLVFFLLMAATALCVLGATTYVLNLVRYGNPFYNIPDSSLDAYMSLRVLNMPKFIQFFASLLAPLSNELYTDLTLKLPFTFSTAEWNAASMDTIVGGWGILFSGILLLSLVVIVRSIYLLSKQRSRQGKFLFILLVVVFLPPFLMPYLFQARYYLQPFWVPMAALICLFAPTIEDDNLIRPAREPSKVPLRLTGVVLCILLVSNCATAFRYLDFQVNETLSSRKTLADIKIEIENNNKVLDVQTTSRGLFYGLLFNLEDEGIRDYNFAENISDVRGSVLYYLPYSLRSSGSDANRDALSFLYSLNTNGYLVVIAEQGTPGALNFRMLTMLNTMALEADAHNPATDNYLTVIDTNAHIRIEESGPGALSETVPADGLTVQVNSAADGASIVIEGTEYALGREGYNIVVYDTENAKLVDSVVINTAATPILSR